jgi:hypothetical protein
MFDAVLLLAVPTFLVWAALGALYVPAAAAPSRRVIPIVLIVIAGLGAARSAMQLTAMQIYATRGDRTSLARARADHANDGLAVMRTATRIQRADVLERATMFARGPFVVARFLRRRRLRLLVRHGRCADGSFVWAKTGEEGNVRPGARRRVKR